MRGHNSRTHLSPCVCCERATPRRHIIHATGATRSGSAQALAHACGSILPGALSVNIVVVAKEVNQHTLARQDDAVAEIKGDHIIVSSPVSPFTSVIPTAAPQRMRRPRPLFLTTTRRKADFEGDEIVHWKGKGTLEVRQHVFQSCRRLVRTVT